MSPKGELSDAEGSLVRRENRPGSLHRPSAAPSGLQKLAPVDDVSPRGTSGAQTGMAIPGYGDDQAHDLQPA